MKITGTHFNYFQVCKRKLWLFASGITFEHTSDLVYDGNLIHEDSYRQRSAKYEEIELEGIKVDYYDFKNRVIHEIKRSNKVERAHLWQLKYYIYVFEQNGIQGVSGILEYPALRKKETVYLSDVDRDVIQEMISNIHSVIDNDVCPPLEVKGICKNCSYLDFCFSKEVEE